MATHHRIFVGTYVIQVRARRDPEPLPLGKFDGHNSLLTYFAEFCERYSKELKRSAFEPVTWQVSQAEQLSTSVYGLVDVGDYGFKAKLQNIETGQRSYTQTTKDTRSIPMFFLLDAPLKATRGIIILQRHGIRSPYSFINEAFKAEFHNRFPNYIIDLKPFVAQSTLNEFREGVLKKITLVRYVSAADLAREIEVQAPAESAVEIQTVIKVHDKRGAVMPKWVARYFKKGQGRGDESEPDLPMGAQRARVTVTRGSVARTVELGAAEGMVPYVEAPSNLPMEDGHPKFDAMLLFAKQILAEADDEIRGGG